MNNISPLKKSAIAVALALGITPGGAHAVLETGLVAYWPLNEVASDTSVKDTLNKCNGAKVGGVTFTPTPVVTGSEMFPYEERLGYEAVPLWHSSGNWGGSTVGPDLAGALTNGPWNGPQFWGNYPRITKVARFNGSDAGITVTDSTTCTGLKTIPTAAGYTISVWARNEDVTAMTSVDAAAKKFPILTRGTDWGIYFESKAEIPGKAIGETTVQRVDRVKFCAGQNCLSYPPTDLSRLGVDFEGPGYEGVGYAEGNPLSWGRFSIRPGWWYNITVTYTKAPAPVPVVGAVPPKTTVPPQAVMYINGIKVAESVAPTPPAVPSPFPPPTATATTNTLLLGNDGTNYLKGRIDDVRIYNVALKRDDVLTLGQGCPPGIFDPKTGKVSIPCVVERSRSSEGYGGRFGITNAWQADLAAVPPKANPNNGGSDEKNMRFTVSKSVPIPLPSGKTLGAYPADWIASEYPWGAMVAEYNENDYDVSRENYDLNYQRLDSWYSTFNFWDFAYLEIPGVKAPSAFGAPGMECYGVELYYDVLNSRFEMGYVWSEGTDCGQERLANWGSSLGHGAQGPAKAETTATTTP